jgi:hypothetical protein
MKLSSNLLAAFAACVLLVGGRPAAWSAEPAVAKVIAISGDVQARGRALKAGDTVAEGEEVASGPESRATLEFSDRSLVRVRTDSRLRIEAHRGSGAPAQAGIRLRLESGAIEVIVAKPGTPGFAIHFPSGSATAASGSEFRARARVEATLVEVVEGTVAVAGAAGTPVEVNAGYGTQLKAAEAPLPPVKLLAAPDVSGIAALQQRPMARLRFAPLAGAVRYRIVAAADRDLREVIVESRPRRPDMRILELDDGEYFYGIRAIDALGLDGLEARGGFRLQARPFPPAAQAPAPDAVMKPGSVAFNWEPMTGETVSYRFQLAADEAFTAPLIDRSGLNALEFTAEKLQAGRYYWRVASVRAAGGQGPFGNPQAFTLQTQ